MQVRRVLLLDDAVDDLREIRRYVYEASHSRFVADAYIKRIRGRLRSLEHTAEAQPRFFFSDDRDSGYRFIPVERHVAFFSIAEGEVHVVRVLHQRMDSGFWIGRM